MVSIDRKGGAKTMRIMMDKIKRRFEEGSSIIIFPEGTRKIPGDKPDYKTGFIGIYNLSKRKLLPIALNSGLFWSKQKLAIRKGNIIIDIQPVIECGLGKEEVFEKVQESIESATDKLLN